MWVMDWLLRAALVYVTRGNLQVTTARGVTLSFGDGTGRADCRAFHLRGGPMGGSA